MTKKRRPSNDGDAPSLVNKRRRQHPRRGLRQQTALNALKDSLGEKMDSLSESVDSLSGLKESVDSLGKKMDSFSGLKEAVDSLGEKIDSLDLPGLKESVDAMGEKLTQSMAENFQKLIDVFRSDTNSTILKPKPSTGDIAPSQATKTDEELLRNACKNLLQNGERNEISFSSWGLFPPTKHKVQIVWGEGEGRWTKPKDVDVNKFAELEEMTIEDLRAMLGDKCVWPAADDASWKENYQNELFDPFISPDRKNEQSTQNDVMPKIKKYMRFAYDARSKKHRCPFFLLKDLGQASQTAQIDVCCLTLPLAFELKLKRHDSDCFDGLQQVLERLRALMIMSDFLTCAYGFACNGSTAFFVVYTRSQNTAREGDSTGEHFFDDNVRVVRISPAHIPIIWNALADNSAQEGVRSFAHEDGIALAHSLTSAFGVNPLGFMRTTLATAPLPAEQQASRVYIVHSSKPSRPNDNSTVTLWSEVNKPLLAVKINTSPQRKNEFRAINRLRSYLREDYSKKSKKERKARLRSTVPIARKLFPIFSASLWEDSSSSELLPEKTVAAYKELVFEGNVEFQAIAEEMKENANFMMTSSEEGITPWWSDLGSDKYLKTMPPFAGVVMKTGRHVNATKLNCRDCLNLQRTIKSWQQLYMDCGMFHTDVREPNVMLFSYPALAGDKKFTEGREWCWKQSDAHYDSLNQKKTNRSLLQDEVAARDDIVFPVLIDFDLAEISDKRGELPSTIKVAQEGARADLIHDLVDFKIGSAVPWNGENELEMAALCFSPAASAPAATSRKTLSQSNKPQAIVQTP